MKDRIKEIEAIAEIFLSDAFEPESWVSKDLTKEERQQRLVIEGKKAEIRNDKVEEILKGEGLDARWVLWLFNELEVKAMNKLGLMAALPQAKRPELLRKHLPDFLIKSSETTYRSKKAIDLANLRLSRKDEARNKWLKWDGTQEEFIKYVIKNLKKKNKGSLSEVSYSERHVRRWIASWKKQIGDDIA